ncbi:MAG: hypothetical protein JST09_09875, partial [Bacteroidetes bacterium]|nr:hypothetical protein [Bacteroidota bacterium]
DLPAQLDPGSYYIRAYTAWMLNFNAAFLFYKKIDVVSEGNTPLPQKENSKAKKDFTVEFFPEGGDLVQRLTSLVAFKATDEGGMPVNITGKVMDSDGATVAFLNTIHDGMGKFAIHCSSKKTYSATVTANGLTKTFPLPVPKNSGIVLYTRHETDSLNDYLYFHLSRSLIEKEKYEDLIICAQMENHVAFSRIRFDEKTAGDPVDTILEANSYLPLKGFPPGILHLTIFSDSAKPLAEQLLFLNPQLIKQSTAITIQTGSSGNEPMNVALTTPPEFKGHLSVTVTTPGYELGPTNSLLSDYYLAELEGYVHRPAWYFEGLNTEKMNAIDLLLLTRKWTRFNWTDLLNEQLPVVRYEPQQSILIKGKAFIANGENKIPYRNKEMIMVFNAPADTINQMINVPTDSTGHFLLDGFNFHDTASLYIYTDATDRKVNKKISVEFISNSTDTVKAPAFTEWGYQSGLNSIEKEFAKNKPALLEQQDSILRTSSEVLNKVTITAKTKTHLDSLISRYATGPFASTQAWAETFDFTDEKGAPLRDWQTIFDFMKGKIKGLEYYYDNESHQYIIVWRMANSLLNTNISESERMRSNAPAFFLNEVLLNGGPEQYNNAYQMLTSISMSQVAMIRVFQPGSLSAVPNNGPHGSIVIYTKNGTEINQQPAIKSAAFNRTTLRGFSTIKSFATMVTSPIATGNSFSKNTTLYWNNNVINPSANTSSFNVSNVSNSTNIYIIAEGLSIDGRPNCLYRSIIP